MSSIDTLSVNALRVVGAKIITKAKSGHPGIVLGSAPILHTLFTRFININPEDDKWFDRDRFILSAGHGSCLLYELLSLSGFGLSIDDLYNFRQKGSITPGHPEYGHTKGVEITTGPLGQGIATSVGMAIAENHMASKFNKSDIKIINHYTYVLCGDGDLQEGVCQEAASLAGHLGLTKLIVLYDANDVQLDGNVELANNESVEKKF
jgi:transketolase